jgi:hypothetical protein
MRQILGDLCQGLLTGTMTLQSRQLTDGAATRQADLFGYMRETAQAACCAVPHGGLQVLSLEPAIPAEAPLAIAADRCFSLYNPRLGPHKYFLAEAYSGNRDDKRREKVRQLDSLLEFTKRRWEDLNRETVSDITAIIGVAGLVFSPGDKSRGAALELAVNLVKTEAAARPLTRRMMQAGRYFVMVLDPSQMPATLFQRDMIQRQDELGRQQFEMGRRLAAIPEEVVALLNKK